MSDKHEPALWQPELPREGVVPVVQSSTSGQRLVLLSKLAPDQKQRVWSWLKHNKPEQAALMQSAEVLALVEGFDASFTMEESELREALRGIDRSVETDDRPARPGQETQPGTTRRQG